jgi:hypothetical protein
MKFTIQIDCDNAAFEDDIGTELSRILRGVAANVESSDIRPSKVPVRDANGNTCGWYQAK